jgi:ketosteroid isomerase-like protein
MRRGIERGIALCCIVTATGCAAKPNAAAPEADSAAVAQSFHARSDALQKAESMKDAEASASFYTEDAVLQGAGMRQINGRSNIVALYKTFFANPNLKELRGTPSSAMISASGDLAYEVGVNRIVMRSPKGDLLDAGKFIVVWKHEKGDWYVAALSFTSDAAAPLPIGATN